MSNGRKLTTAWLVWMLSIAGCSHQAGNQFFCPVQPSYTDAGQVDTTGYRVDTQCYKSMTKKLTACYDEAK